MNMKPRQWAIVLLSVAIASTTACSSINRGTARQSQQPGTPSPTPFTPQTANESGFKINMLQAEEGRIPIATINGKSYIPAAKLAELLDYQMEWDAATNTLQMGSIDPDYELTGGSNRATKEGDPVTLREAPVVSDGALQIPVSALGELFQDDFSYELRNGAVALKPSADMIERSALQDGAEPDGTDDELSFADDPSDPYKGGEEPVALMLPPQFGDPYARDSIEAVPVLKNIDMNKLIATAKRYMGVKYKFGAKPYPQSGRFDCSTFTQYVLGKYGVTLPRLARTQATKGTLVSRKNLRKGDLLFFYVPGRFKTNKTVGHVGIYMGNNLMIHSSPAPDNGVQISNINHKYWKKTFLRAKRVAY